MADALHARSTTRTSQVPPATGRRRSGFGRVLFALLVLLIILGAAAFVGDRVARGRAQEQVAGSMQTYLATQQRPDVTIGGWPFLTQVASNRYSDLHLRAAGVTTTEIPLQLLDITLTGVDADTAFTRAVASHAQGGATVAWSEVAARANNLPVTHEAPDRLKVEYETQILGVKVKAVVTARPTIDKAAQTIVLAEPVLTVANTDLPRDVTDRLIGSLVQPIPVPLPPALKATNARATADGLIIDFEGENVDLLHLQ